MEVLKQFSLALALCAPVAVFGGTFSNGSFESPGGGPGVRCQIDNSSCFVTDWLSNGGFQVYEDNGQDGINAGDGTFWVSFGHLGVTGGTLSQTFDTLTGHTYNVDFLLIVQQGTGAQSSLVEVLDGSNVLGFSADTFTSNSWVSGTGFSFIAASNSTTLRITDTTADSGCCNWGLDGVTVVDQDAAPGVPEPASLTLLGSALVAAGIICRRRARR